MRTLHNNNVYIKPVHKWGCQPQLRNYKRNWTQIQSPRCNPHQQGFIGWFESSKGPLPHLSGSISRSTTDMTDSIYVPCEISRGSGCLSLKKWSDRNFTKHSVQSFSFTTKGEQELLKKKFTKIFRVSQHFAHVVFEETVQMNLNDAALPQKSWQQRPDVRAVETGLRCQADD